MTARHHSSPGALDRAFAILVLALIASLFVLLVPKAASAQGGLDLPMRPAKFGDPSPTATEKEKRKAKAYVPALTAQDEADEADDPSDTPPPVFFGEEMESETDSIVYVLDESGSMRRFRTRWQTKDGTTVRGTRWERAVYEASLSIEGLAESFTFSIWVYECGVDAWPKKGRPVEATTENKKAALSFLASRQPWGPTGTGAAVSKAIKRPVGLCVLLTDGAPNCGSEAKKSATDGAHANAHREIIRRNNRHATPINVFGIQADKRAYRRFCEGVANDSKGRFFEIQ